MKYFLKHPLDLFAVHTRVFTHNCLRVSTSNDANLVAKFNQVREKCEKVLSLVSKQI